MSTLSLALISPLRNPKDKIGKAQVVRYDPQDSSLTDLETGESALPRDMSFVKEIDLSVPENAVQVTITPRNYMKIWEELPKDISKTPFYFRASDDFRPEDLPHVTFVLHHQLITNARTPLIPYFNIRVKEHLDYFVFSRPYEKDLTKPMEHGEDAISLAFWLVAVQLLIGKVVILVHDDRRGPLVLPPQLQGRPDDVIDITPRNGEMFKTRKNRLTQTRLIGVRKNDE